MWMRMRQKKQYSVYFWGKQKNDNKQNDENSEDDNEGTK